MDVVWFKGSVPKHSFTMCVANGDRLPTRARLASWGMPIPTSCALCSSNMETRDYLFIACDYSKQVWKEVLLRCRSPSRLFTNWSELLSWIRSSNSKRITLLRKLACQAVVFHLWKQRNNVVHNKISLPASVVFHGIDRYVCNIISARKSRKGFSSLMTMWLR